MKNELIVDVQQNEITIALTENDRLQEVNKEEKNIDNYSVGNIYLGRVKKLLPALNAVFVDVGYEKEAFLHFLDLGPDFLTTQNYLSKAMSDRRKAPSMLRIQRMATLGKEGQISDYLKVGDLLLVQVTKEPINTKGPRLTAEISIAGRNIVLIPFADKVMISSKIKRESERSRLKQLVQSIKPHGFGVIVRTSAEDKRVAELDNEMQILVKRWDETIHHVQHPKENPLIQNNKDKDVCLVCQEIGRTIGLIRDLFNPNFSAIHVNDEGLYNEVRQYVELIAPESIKIVKHYKGTQPILDKYDITRQMKTGLGRIVGFKEGGYLVIDKTEALFSIDVNSGTKKVHEDQEENAFHFNMLAAEEIAHQLRLRDIGGIIIVDFIDMDSKEHQQQLYDKMKELMSRDRAKHNLLPLSKFGLMQITRQRVRPALEIDVMDTCPTCKGKGKVQPGIMLIDEVETQLSTIREQYKGRLNMHLHPYVYSYVTRGWISSLKRKWNKLYRVNIIEDQCLNMLDVKYYDEKGEKVAVEGEKRL